MMRRIGVLATALTLLAVPQWVGAQTQVGADYFNQPTRTLINFDTDPGDNPIASGALLQNVYSAYDISFDANDQAVAFDNYGTSAPNQATGSADELQGINVYFARPADAAGAWGYDFTMKAFDKDGGVILQVAYSDGRPCPADPFSFREQRFLGIAADRPIYQVQFGRFFQDQVACGFRIDDFQFLRQDPPPPPTPITGNVQIAWNSCLGTGTSQPYVTFDCDETLGSIYNLVGSFQVQDPMADFITLGISMDVVLDGQTGMPAFWHFENGGCNSGGVAVDDVFPASCTGFGTPWGASGASSDALLLAYQPGFNYANYGRLLAAVARASNDPTNLAGAPSRYFGWTLQFFMDNAGTCAGCDLSASLRVNSLTLFTTAGGPGYLVSPAAAGSAPCVAINNGGSLCDPTSTRNTTWGRLKSLYR
jgi:hypothetical protein